MNKNTEKKLPRQQINQYNLIPVVESLSRIELGLLNRSLEFQNANLPTIYTSQNTFAKRVGICRGTANKRLHVLDEKNLIAIENRGPNKTCLYEINPLFLSLSIRRALKHLLPALMFFPVSLLLYYEQKNNNALIDKQYSTTRLELDYLDLSNSIVVDYNNLSDLDYREYLDSRDSHEHQKKPRDSIQVEKIAMNDTNNLISQVIIGLKDELNLTLAGQCKFTAYPDFILQEAYILFLKDTNEKPDKFAAYVKILDKLCSEQHIVPRWKRMYENMERLGVPEQKKFSLGPSKQLQKREYKDKSSLSKPREYTDPLPPLSYYRDWKAKHPNKTCDKCFNGFCLDGNIRAWIKRTTPELRNQAAESFPVFRKFIPSAFKTTPPPSPSETETDKAILLEQANYLAKESKSWQDHISNADQNGPHMGPLLKLAHASLARAKRELAELISRIGSNPNEEVPF